MEEEVEREGERREEVEEEEEREEVEEEEEREEEEREEERREEIEVEEEMEEEVEEEVEERLMPVVEREGGEWADETWSDMEGDLEREAIALARWRRPEGFGEGRMEGAGRGRGRGRGRDKRREEEEAVVGCLRRMVWSIGRGRSSELEGEVSVEEEEIRRARQDILKDTYVTYV